jgi:mRNA-degrading endonuclease RelE of RelBE toxin-antitoxin system
MGSNAKVIKKPIFKIHSGAIGLTDIRQWRTIFHVVFIETPTFTKSILKLLDDESYSALQLHLAGHPDSGDIIRGSGGIRKIRWAGCGRGKRGGLRIIYYWWTAKDRISMLLVYPKNEQDDLSADQVKQLRKALEI